ncbi:unnamed protein product [Linum tenue]|uniref:GRF-type domain-containing protein n=1 Tax=Linum tenue TaxID=586396 RepID=A0AAV0KMA8_9ROSI|nr:unnamed protein product [Linum tenue]
MLLGMVLFHYSLVWHVNVLLFSPQFWAYTWLLGISNLLLMLCFDECILRSQYFFIAIVIFTHTFENRHIIMLTLDNLKKLEKKESSRGEFGSQRFRQPTSNDIMCECGRLAVVRISRTTLNPNRKFFCCAKRGSKKVYLFFVSHNFSSYSVYGPVE